MATPRRIEIEGGRLGSAHVNTAERRLSALAEAVREHERRTRRQLRFVPRYEDAHLYRRLRQILGEI